MKSSRRRLLRYKLLLAFCLAAVIGVAGPSFLKFSSENAEPLLRAAVEAATTDSITLTAPLQIPSMSGVVLERGRIGLAGSRSSRARGSEATRALLDSGRADLVLSEAVISIDPVEFGKALPPAGPASAIAPLVAAMTGLSFDELRIDDATIVIHRSDGGRDILSRVDAQLVATRKQQINATGKLSYLGTPLDFEATLSNTNEIRQGARLPLLLKLKGPLIESEIDGTVVLAEQPQLVSTRARMSVLDVPGMARLFGLSWPKETGPTRIDARGKFMWAGRTVALDDAAFVFDGSEATGAMSLALTNKRPLLDATLAFGSLDVGRYLSDRSTTRKHAEILPGLNGLLSGSQASAAPPGSELDADVRISADEIVGLPLKVGHFATTLGLKSGHLSADVTGFEAEGCAEGRAEINIDLDLAQPKTVLTGRCERFDLSAAASLLLGHAPLEGRGTAVVDLTARGRTLSDLQSTLAGKIDLSIAEGGRIGVSVPVLAADKRLKSDGLVESPSWGQTPVESLRARCVAEAGIFRLTEFDAAAGQTRLQASGTFSVPARVVDVTLRTAKYADTGLQKNSTSAPSDAAAIRILGPWNKPFLRAATESDVTSPAASDTPASRTGPQLLGAPAE